MTSCFLPVNGILTGNCSTAETSFALFMLLLNGSGVGRDYSDTMMLVDWAKHMPNVIAVLDETHPDFQWGRHMSRREAQHLYGKGDKVRWFTVKDSREGWGQAVEAVEVATFENGNMYATHYSETLILDFTEVRGEGQPIMGMQGRPSSGPAPLMDAIAKIARIKGSGLKPWRATLYIDHYLAEPVLVGGARRSARMSTKWWQDADIFDFIGVKRPVEFDGLSREQVEAYLKTASKPLSFLWSSNNSVAVDKDFWNRVNGPITNDPLTLKAKMVYEHVTACAYTDGTGEPGFINVGRLTAKNDGIDTPEYAAGLYVGSLKFQPTQGTVALLRTLYECLGEMPYHYVVNPCITGETWIETGDGPRRVCELIGKPFTAMVDGRPYAAPLGFFQTGIRPVFRVTTTRGYSIRATADHKMLVETGRRGKLGGGYNYDHDWIRVADLRPGDQIVLDAAPCPTGQPDAKSFGLGWLLGEMAGDGGYNPDSYNGYLRFWGEHAELMARRTVTLIKAYLAPRSDFKGGQRNATNGSVTVMSSELSALARRLIEPKTKVGTDLLETMPPNFVRGFLSGLFDTDGSVQGSTAKGVSIRLSQTSYAQLQMVQRMLLRLGITSTIYRNRSQAGETVLPDGKGGSRAYQTKACHELVISNSAVSVFRDVIGLHQPEKSARLDEVLAGRKRALNADKFLAKVEHVAADGAEPVYDCSVEGAHQFAANGLIVHNCDAVLSS